MESNKINILYVDDEVNNLVAFKANFRKEYSIHTAESAKEALQILNENTIHIIISDQRMPGMTGVEFLETVIKTHPNPIRILLTGYSDIQTVIEAINKGQVYKYIMKPFDEMHMRVTISNAYEIYALREENRNLIERLKLANEQLEFMLRQKLLS